MDPQLTADLNETFHLYFTTDDGTGMHHPTDESIAEASAAQESMPKGHQYATGPFVTSAQVDAYEQHQVIHDER